MVQSIWTFSAIGKRSTSLNDSLTTWTDPVLSDSITTVRIINEERLKWVPHREEYITQVVWTTFWWLYCDFASFLKYKSFKSIKASATFILIAWKRVTSTMQNYSFCVQCMRENHVLRQEGENPSLLALNGGGRIFLSPSSPLSSLLCSLVSWETLSTLLSKLKYYGLTGLLMQLTPSKLGFRGTWLPWRNVPSGLYDGAWERWRIVCLAALSVEDIDIYLFGTMITGILLIGLGFTLGYRRIQKTGTAVQSPTRLPVWLKLWEERSALRLNYNRNMDSTKEKFTALQREID